MTLMPKRRWRTRRFTTRSACSALPRTIAFSQYQLRRRARQRTSERTASTDAIVMIQPAASGPILTKLSSPANQPSTRHAAPHCAVTATIEANSSAAAWSQRQAPGR